jgi:hypothetical protein
VNNQPNAATGHTPEPWIRKPVLSLNGRTIELDDIDYARAELCVNALAGIPDPAAFVARARGQEAAIAELQEMVNVCEMDRNRALAELARLRPIAELYPLAWKECHAWRCVYGMGGKSMGISEVADAHDKARADRGVQ